MFKKNHRYTIIINLKCIAYFLDIIMPKRVFFYYSKIGKWGLIAVGCLLWFGHADIYIDMLTVESLKYIEYFLKHWIWL